jgi:hypothetical protein
MHLTINFREQAIRVSFQEFDELIHYMHQKFSVLIFETRNAIFYFNTKLYNCNIFEILFYGIEQSLQTCLITREAVANILPGAACQVRFSRGRAWMNENFYCEGENLHTAIQTLNPRLVENHRTSSQRV